MGSVEVAVAIVIVVVFALGIAIGIVLVVSFASRREDRLLSLWGEAPGPACGARAAARECWVRGGRPVSGRSSSTARTTRVRAGARAVSGFELVAGVIAAFFAFGIVAGVLGVIALSAMRGHRARGERHRGSGEYHLEPDPAHRLDPPRTVPGKWRRPPACPGRAPCAERQQSLARLPGAASGKAVAGIPSRSLAAAGACGASATWSATPG